MSKGTKHPVDELVRSKTELERMDLAETDRVWAVIEEKLLRAGQPEPASYEPDRRSVRVTPRRRLVLGAGLAVVVAIVITATIALLPSGSDPGGKTFDLHNPPLASAAEVLAAAADGASQGESLVPGPGQQLMFREVLTDPTSKTPYFETVTEWIDNTGKGTRQGTADLGSSSSEVEAGPPAEVDFDIGAGPDRSIGIGQSWRAVLSYPEVRALSTDPAELLSSLRGYIGRSIGTAPDYGASIEKVVGRDLVVMMTINHLLTQAPLDGRQRAALFDLVMSSPGWYRSQHGLMTGVENLGRAETADGRPAMKIRTTLLLTTPMLGAKKGEWWMDLLVDPAAGRILELRETEAGGEKPYGTTTTEQLEIIDVEAGES